MWRRELAYRDLYYYGYSWRYGLMHEEAIRVLAICISVLAIGWGGWALATKNTAWRTAATLVLVGGILWALPFIDRYVIYELSGVSIYEFLAPRSITAIAAIVVAAGLTMQFRAWRIREG